MTMKLYPCVLLGDFGTAKLADTVTTAQVHRWSTTDNTDFAPSLTRAQALWDRRSLRIATTASSNGESVNYGVSGTDLTKIDIANAFGSDINDLTWCTNLAAWLYHTDDFYDGTDADEFQLYVTDGATPINVNWASTFNAADRWLWSTGTPASGTFASNGDNIEQFGFKSNDAYTASSYFYINTFMAYRSTLSTTGNDYHAGNAIELATSSYIPEDQNAWRVTGNLVGDRPVDLARQLHQMSTLDLQILHPVRRPTPKYQALHDCDNIKVYLMYQEETLGHELFIANSGKTVTAAVPVIITNVRTEWTAPSKKIISFSFDAHRFAGV